MHGVRVCQKRLVALKLFELGHRELAIVYYVSMDRQRPNVMKGFIKFAYRRNLSLVEDRLTPDTVLGLSNLLFELFL